MKSSIAERDIVRNERKRISREHFADIYSLTLKLCGIESSAAPCSRGVKKCWADIVNIWTANRFSLACNDIFYEALYRIHWRVFPRGVASPILRELLLLVAQELLTDGYAFDVWRTIPEFKRAFDRILDTKPPRTPGRRAWHSESFRRYLYTRTFSKVIYKDLVPKYDWSTLTCHEWHSFRVASELRGYYQNFEEAILCLLPEASNWNEEWANEKHILHSIQQVYGIDYTTCYTEFDKTIKVISLILNGRPYLRDLLTADTFTYQMATAVWGKAADRKIIGVFSMAYRNYRTHVKKSCVNRTYSAYSRETIMNSWTFKLLEEWRNTSDLRLTAKTKAKLMDFCLGII